MDTHKRTRYSQNKRNNNNKRKVNTVIHTLDEFILLLLVFGTFGLVYAFAQKPDTSKSKIHSFFKYFDYFEPQTPKNLQPNKKDKKYQTNK